MYQVSSSEISNKPTDKFANHSNVHLMKIIHSSVDLWNIPQGKALDQLVALHRVEKRSPHYHDDLVYSYSATSAFIRFQQSLSPTACANLRNVFLNEYRCSVARPECHAVGLVRICQENPKLRIVRSVNLWQTVLPVHDEKVQSGDIAKAVGAWTAECHILPSLGMPSSSYSLVFDGQTNPEKSTAVFSVLQ